MHRMMNFLDDAARPPHRGLPRWLATAACVVAIAAATLTAEAQTPAEVQTPAEAPTPPDTQETAQPTSTTEPAAAAEPDAAAQPDSEPPPAWNRPRAAPRGVDAQLTRLAADLGLDAGQQEKIRPILVAQRDEMQRLQHDPRLSPAERQQRILAVGDRTANQIRAQLTDAQRAQYIKPRAATVVAQSASPARRSPAPTSTPGAEPARK
jgi:hypothetical protein